MAETEVWPFEVAGEVSALERRWLSHYYSLPFAGPTVRARALGYKRPDTPSFRQLDRRMRAYVLERSQREAAKWALLQKRYGRKACSWPLPPRVAAALGFEPGAGPGSDQPGGESANGSEAGGANGHAEGKPGALALPGRPTAIPTRDTVLLRIEHMHQLLEAQLEAALDPGEPDPVMAQSAIKGMLDTVKELAKGVGANKAEEEAPPAVPIFLGVPRETDLATFAKQYGYVIVEDGATVQPGER